VFAIRTAFWRRGFTLMCATPSTPSQGVCQHEFSEALYLLLRERVDAAAKGALIEWRDSSSNRSRLRHE
jgi:hypothetical protein